MIVAATAINVSEMTATTKIYSMNAHCAVHRIDCVDYMLYYLLYRFGHSFVNDTFAWSLLRLHSSWCVCVCAHALAFNYLSCFHICFFFAACFGALCTLHSIVCPMCITLPYDYIYVFHVIYFVTTTIDSSWCTYASRYAACIFVWHSTRSDCDFMLQKHRHRRR